MDPQKKLLLLQRAHEFRQSLLQKSTPSQSMEATCHDSLHLFDLNLVISQKLSERSEITSRINELLERLTILLESNLLDSSNDPRRETFKECLNQKIDSLECKQKQQRCDELKAQLKQKEQECIDISEQLRYCSRLLRFVTEERDNIVVSLRSTVENMTREREALERRSMEEHDTIKNSFHDIIKNLAAENEMLRQKQFYCQCSKTLGNAVDNRPSVPRQRGLFANFLSWN